MLHIYDRPEAGIIKFIFKGHQHNAEVRKKRYNHLYCFNEGPASKTVSQH